MPVRNFCVVQSQRNTHISSKLQRLKQRLNRRKSNLSREKHKMKVQQQSNRKARTRLLIQAGGILHKSGIMEAFSIAPDDDLQAYENFEKAAQLLGFLTMCFEENNFDEANLEEWRSVGERLMRSG